MAPPIEKIIRPDYATNLGDTAGPSNIENTETDINEPVENSGQAEDSDMLFNPGHVIGKVYQLVYRKDHKLCPQGVKRCEICARAFVEEDIVVVKTVGERHFCKDGQEQRTRGNVYLHFLTKGLQDYDKKFEIKHVRIPRRTAEQLPANVLGGFQKKGMKVV